MGVMVVTQRKRVLKERGKRLISKCNSLVRSVKGAAGLSILLAGTQALPSRVFAATSLEAATTQVKVGTLPLLAALGLGIAVAVAAVIAFLQMAARGKESNEASLMSIEDEQSFHEYNDQEWNAEEASGHTDRETDYEHHDPLTDYTIPITRVLTHPEQAEHADNAEPRLCGIEGEHAGTCYRILNRRLTFGRDPTHCSILFPYEAGEISRIHCTVRFIEESRLFILEDNGSSNGTFLSNGERLQPGVRYELQAGARFSLSGKDHMFELRDREEDNAQYG